MRVGSDKSVWFTRSGSCKHFSMIYTANALLSVVVSRGTKIAACLMQAPRISSMVLFENKEAPVRDFSAARQQPRSAAQRAGVAELRLGRCQPHHRSLYAQKSPATVPGSGLLVRYFYSLVFSLESFSRMKSSIVSFAASKRIHCSL